MLVGCSGKKDEALLMQLSEKCAEVLLNKKEVKPDATNAFAALDYLQNALKDLSAEKKNRELRAKIMDQAAHLLVSKKMYKEAMPYIEGVMNFFSDRKDTMSTVATLHELGGAYAHAGGLSKAEECFLRSLDLSSRFSPKQSAVSRMYLGEVKHRLGQIDSALYYIRNTPSEVPVQARNSALAYASGIYLDAGIPDTAYAYSCELLRSSDKRAVRKGYEVILDPRLRAYTPHDSVDAYMSRYKDVLEDIYGEDQSHLAMTQEDLYDQIDSRRQEDASLWSRIFALWPLGLIAVFFVMLASSLYLKIRNRDRLRELHIAVESLNSGSAQQMNFQMPEPVSAVTSDKDEGKEMQETLRERLLAEVEKGADPVLSPAIAQSEAYEAVQTMIQEGRCVPFDDSIWSGLEEAVLAASPDFKKKLQILTGNRFTTVDYHTALMIKCQIAPIQMATLTGRSKGAIMSRREALCSKIYDRKLPTKIFDTVIRLL
jgi:hypothetical protein